MKIAPSLLSADFADLKSSIKKVEEYADLLHIDVMDGVFVPNISIGPVVIKALKKHFKMPFDVHLMITEPIRYIDEFVNAGSDILTIHYEACENPENVLKYIKKLGIKCGISIKPNTKLEEIYSLLAIVDLVLVMSVNPGFGGQKFMNSSIDKIKKLSELKNKYNYEISVDGGINEKTSLLVKEAGADILVAGSYIFENSNPVEAIRRIKGE